MDSPPKLVPMSKIQPNKSVSIDKIANLLSMHKLQMNGTASGMEFASSTGSGGTWQRDNSNGNSYNTNGISNGMNGGYSMMSNSNNMQSAVTFKCSECAISKYNCEDLEIHIKTEHLNWLPFRCQFCSAQRASDAQMREHVYSSHKRDDNKVSSLCL